MNVTVHCVSDTYDVIETFTSLDEAIRQLREMWCETDSSECFIFQDEETKATLATMIRPSRDKELCILTFDDGRCETWRCHYVLDAEGSFERCEVSEC